MRLEKPSASIIHSSALPHPLESRFMTRQTIESLKPQKSVDEVYRVVDKQTSLESTRWTLSAASIGRPYRRDLGNAMECIPSPYDSFQKGDFLEVKGMAQLHNGNLQLILQDFDTVDPKRIDPRDFDALDRSLMERHWNRLLELIRTIESPEVQALVQSFATTK